MISFYNNPDKKDERERRKKRKLESSGRLVARNALSRDRVAKSCVQELLQQRDIVSGIVENGSGRLHFSPVKTEVSRDVHPRCEGSCLILANKKSWRRYNESRVIQTHCC